jgi:hypothetical protein
VRCQSEALAHHASTMAAARRVFYPQRNVADTKNFLNFSP